MSETKMPAAEAAGTEERELLSYELAFHVLPTVAEGEVTAVFDKIKSLITKAKGEVTGEEAPARFELAYEISKYLEGRNRKFSSAYFGWVRFTLEPVEVEGLREEVEEIKELLRSILIRLTKVEEENPFEFHPSVASRVVENVEVPEKKEEVEEEKEEESEEAEEATDGEEEEKTV